MFDDLVFKVPKTAYAAMGRDPAAPRFNSDRKMRKTMGVRWKSQIPGKAESREKYMKQDEARQRKLRNIFGMVKCIDDNVGKILQYLKKSGLHENTIVIFTSDHGDLMGEHLRDDKNMPYETSVVVPFIIKYPGHVPAGKIISTPYSSVDFAPTILSLMDLNETSFVDSNGTASLDGIEGSSSFHRNQRDMLVNGNPLVVINNKGEESQAMLNDSSIYADRNAYDYVSGSFHGKDGKKELLETNGNFSIREDLEPVFSYSLSYIHPLYWVAASTSRYKLVISNEDVPWFFDLEKDPDELINQFSKKEYVSIKNKLKERIREFMIKYELPDINKLQWQTVSCRDSDDVLPYKRESKKRKLCADILQKDVTKKCKEEEVQNHCPLTCGKCKTKK